MKFGNVIIEMDKIATYLTLDYERAIAHCAGAILRLHAGERVVNKIFGRAAQSHAAGLLLVMASEARLGLGSRPTLGVIQKAIGKPRTIAAFIALLRFSGFVSVEADPDDRRSPFLVPSERLQAGLSEWLAHHMLAGEIMGLVPSGLAARMRADPDYRTAMFAASRQVLERSRAAMAGPGAAAWFDAFDCGDRIALVLLDRHYSQALRTGEAFAFSSRQTAALIGISHGHVRNVINAAAEAGYLTFVGQRDRIVLSPRMLREFGLWHERFWTWVGEAARSAQHLATALPPVPEGGDGGEVVRP
jgi:hypothetical protein